MAEEIDGTLDIEATGKRVLMIISGTVKIYFDPPAARALAEKLLECAEEAERNSDH